VITLALVTPSAFAQLYTHVTKLASQVQYDYFGAYVAVSGDTLAVSTSSNRRIYIYTRTATGWSLQGQINTTGNNFSDGQVSIDGNTLVAGDQVYVRSGSTWTLQWNIPHDIVAPVIKGDTLAVGVEIANPGPNGNEDGAVYIYQRTGTTWALQASFSPPAGSREHVGHQIAFDGDTIVAATLTPKAYVLRRYGSTWTTEGTLVPCL
jgi:hypothetical protein